jgi:hypothetical protein
MKFVMYFGMCRLHDDAWGSDMILKMDPRDPDMQRYSPYVLFY